MEASAPANQTAQPPQHAWPRVAMLALALLAGVRIAYLAAVSSPSAERAPQTAFATIPSQISKIGDSGVRLASAEVPAVGVPGADEIWLVDPQEWFAPEDPGLGATTSAPVLSSGDSQPPQAASAKPRIETENESAVTADTAKTQAPSDPLATLGSPATKAQQVEDDSTAISRRSEPEGQTLATVEADAITLPGTTVESERAFSPAIDPSTVEKLAPSQELAEEQLVEESSSTDEQSSSTEPARAVTPPPVPTDLVDKSEQHATPSVAPAKRVYEQKLFLAPGVEEFIAEEFVKTDVGSLATGADAAEPLAGLALGADDPAPDAERIAPGTIVPTPSPQFSPANAGGSGVESSGREFDFLQQDVPQRDVPQRDSAHLGSPHSGPPRVLTQAEQQRADVAHAELFAKNCYPSAAECATCHKKQYEEWRISSHAYAFVSPMFHKFEQKISDLSQGTVGYFCQRCHSPVGTAMGMNRTTPLWEQPLVAREGVTCIACHRVNEQYSRQNGERRIVPGDITAPVYGGIGGSGVAEAIARREEFKVKTSPHEPGAGQVIHNEGRFFQQLSHAEFCTSCHQVAVHPGIKLEVVWDQYRRSPACEQGVSCQDCHMGKKPGEASGYEITSIAEVGGKSVNTQRKHANHTFYGPNYSIAHPGVFPHNADAERWRMDKWLQFDWRAGWGTDAFEDAVAEGQLPATFPPAWADPDDRYDARVVIDDNLRLIAKKRVIREQVMGHSLQVKGPFFQFTPTRGSDLRMHYDVTNLNSGHNVLTASLGAQPQLWANVVLIGPDGRRLWETGYTDSNGDVCDLHSHDVRAGRMKFDRQLFNLQTMFLITGATGTDRELPLPVNVSFDQLPFLRPGTLPVSVTNHPPFIRMESRSISPLGTKRVKYNIPGHLLQQPGRYRLTFRMRNRIEPIYFMKFCDATDEMVRAMNEGILDINVRSVEFWVK